MSAATVKHWEALEHKRALGLGILYNNHARTRAKCLADADLTGSKIERSTTAFCVFVGGNVLSWKSKKQSVVCHNLRVRLCEYIIF